MELQKIVEQMYEIATKLKGGSAICLAVGLGCVLRWMKKHLFLIGCGCFVMELVWMPQWKGITCQKENVIVIEDRGEREGYSQGTIRFKVYGQSETWGIQRIRMIGNGNVLFQETFAEDRERISGWQQEMVISDAEEGSYHLKVEMTDQAGQIEIRERIWQVDKTPPEMNLAFQKGGWKSETAEDVEIIVRVKEVYFDEKLWNIVWNDTAEKVELSGWQAVGNGSYECKICCKKEGWYELQVSGEDCAGNPAVSETYQWRIDKTAPQLFLQGIEDQKHYQKPMKIKGWIEEEQLEEKKTGWKLIGKEQGELPLQVSGDKKKIIWELSEDMKDDWYTLSVCAEDFAGNRLEETIVFCLNQAGPRYEISGAKDGGIYKENPEITIRIKDKSRLVQYQILYGRESEVTALKAEDYQIQEQWEETQWMYEIRLQPKIFQREGIYTLTVYAKDEAGNENSSIKNSEGMFRLQFQMKRIEDSSLVKKREAEKIQAEEIRKKTEIEYLDKEEVKKTGKIESSQLERKIETAIILCIVGNFMIGFVRKGRKMGKKENEKK